MEYKKAVTILMGLLKKHKFDEEGKKAVLTVIGVLDLASLAKKSINRRIKAQKAKREKSIEW